MKTKNKILLASLNLFNKKGLENVTTRHVAEELDMSQGNLHYHFANKNELIRALYTDFKLGVVERAGYRKGEFGLCEIYGSLQRNFEWMYQYRFLFLDREIVWRRTPEIRRETQVLIIVKSRQLKAAIDTLKTQRIFRIDIDENQIESFINMYQVMINSWLTAVYLFPNQNPARFFADQAFRVWYPYLTSQGQEVFMNSLKNK